ncbi:MAG: hypothetical protein LBD06_04455 [Candidatus Accumulibacter sp.]|nr:hypothetical protein [Accumulibacter sp.]
MFQRIEDRRRKTGQLGRFAPGERGKTERPVFLPFIRRMAPQADLSSIL